MGLCKRVQRSRVSRVTRSLTCHMPLLLLTVKIQRRHSSHGGNIITRWRRMGRPSAVFINKKKKESPVFFGTLGPRQLAAEIMTGETLAAGWLLESGDSSGGKPKKRLRRILAFCCPPPREVSHTCAVIIQRQRLPQQH